MGSLPPEVLNKHHRDARAGGAVYVGRGSKYGSPFKIGPGMTRDQACDAYEAYACETFTREEIVADLEGRDLLCFCSPRRCHADWLLRMANPLL